MRKLHLLLLLLLLSGCSAGPDSQFQLAQQGLLSADLSRDGSYSVIGSIHHGGSLWDVDRNERIYSWNLKEDGFSSFRTVALSGNGKVAVTTEEKSIAVWSTETGESLGYWQAADRVLSVAVDESGTKALIGMRDGGLDLFDLKQGSVIQRLNHSADVRSVAISSNGKVGLSGSDDFTAIAWDLDRGEKLHVQTLRNQIKTVTLSESGDLAFTSSQREGASIWETLSGKVISQLDSRYTNYASARFSTDEETILLGTSAGQVELRSVRSGDVQKEWQAAPRKAYGGASSKAILAVNIGTPIKAMTADGMLQSFK